LGLVNFVIDDGELEGKLTQLIAQLEALPMETVRHFKDLVNHALFTGLETHLDKERFYVAEFASRPLFKQRIEEFLKKK
ncbi:MAG: hypothetical protein HY770_01945, partial [Chitinivibrionia bacterium]|nr:hypothetical protein [Chitinivibrionia bacterium]